MGMYEIERYYILSADQRAVQSVFSLGSHTHAPTHIHAHAVTHTHTHTVAYTKEKGVKYT